MSIMKIMFYIIFFIILKEWDEKNSVFIKKCIQHIKLFEIKNINDLDSFSDWWNTIAIKLSFYEGQNSNIELLFMLNSENIISPFKIEYENIFYLRPILPWNYILYDYIDSQKNLISKLKYIIKNKK